MADVNLLSVLFITLLSFLQIFSQEIRNGISSKTLHLAPHLRSTDNYPKPFLIKSDFEDHQFVRAKQRSKRSAESPQPNIDNFALNDSHSQLLVHWAGKGSDVVICLAYDRQQDENSTSQVFISYDYGKSFTERQKELMAISHTKPSIINMFYISPVLNSHFVFTDVTNKYIFTTLDFGRTFEKVQLLFKPEILALHPTNHKIILAMDKDDPMKKLYLSEDFGATWNPIESHVKAFFWGNDKLYPPNTLFVERHTSTVIRTTDFFKNRENSVVVISGIEDFEAHDKYLFATKRQHLLGSHNHNGTLQLWVSYNGQPFQNALFPSHLERKDFYIADASEDQVFVCVMHDDFTANLYISDIRGATFSLSLERIFYISPAVRGGILESDKELIDFHKVQGLRGVYIATQLKGNSLQSSPLENMVSVITFDKGGKWQNLTAPKVDKDGDLFNCKESEGCSLHVSQKFSQLYSRTRIPPILSRESAVGIVVASGVLGKSLKGHPSVFVSSDAGLTWHHVLYGSYLYNFGDFGSVILAVQYYSQGGETDQVLYSLDDGETWKTLKLFNDENMSIRIYGLMTEPGEKTTTFTLFGSRPDRHQWVLIKIDLRDAFPYSCQPDNYKFWSPHGPNKTCLLGRTEVYQRRIPRTRCYNGQNYERPIRTENCPCSIYDFECDFGFKEDLYTGHCIRDGDSGTDPYAIPYTCKPGAFYNRTKGYRKISGDTCVGGEDYRYGPELMSCPVSEEAEFLIVTERRKISRIALNTEGKVWEDLPLPNLKNPVAVEYDYHNNCIYWADYDDGEVARLCLDGKSEVEVIYHSKESTLEGLALDWISRNLYLVDGMKHLVKMLYVNSTFPIHFQRTVLNESHVDKPRGIAVHPIRGYLFITDWSDTNPRIVRTYLDGSNFVTLVNSQVVSWPNGITIDYQGERIFWVDAREDYIASSDFDGHHIKKVLEGGSVPHVFGVAVYKDWIYFGDWDKRGIFVANKYDGSGLFTLAPTTNQPMDLKVFAHGMQQGNNMCNNASISPCTHLCSIHPHNQRVCLCPDGAEIQILNNGNEKCFCPGNILMLPNGSCPSVSSTCSHEQFHCSNDICIPNTWKCDGDNDCLDSSDETNCDVKVCNSNQFSCHSGHCIPKVWHCDFDNDCVDDSDELNCNYPPCTGEQFQCQNGRCINKNYRCDFDDDCKDGSDEVNCTLPSTFCHNNEFSCRNSKQCLPGTWKCDGERDCKDGSDEENCTISTCEQWQHRCTNGHCIFKSWLCDGEDDCEDNSDEQNCSHTTAIPLTSSTPDDTSCYFNFKCLNNKCIPLKWMCDKVDDCGDNSDEVMCDNTTLTTTTTAKPTTSRKPDHCGEDRYRCNSGLCIWNSWVCDGTKDCENGEDENNCQPGAVCPLGQFRCVHSGGCIDPADLCNGKHDCGDGSDEWGCRNDTHTEETTIHPFCQPEKHFQCKIIGECIDIVHLCNHREDCIDGSDEWNCSREQNYYLVKNLMVDTKTITPTDFTVIWEPPVLEKNLTFKYRPSITESDGTNWNDQKWIMTSNFTFTGLLPGKKYKVRIDASLKNQSQFTPSDYYIYVVTENKAPSAPTNLAVEQRGQTVFVKWSPPLNYSGAIFGYKIYVSPPTPPHVEKINQENTTHILFNSSMFIPGVNYTFWATAFSDSLESINSKLVYLLYDKNFTLSSISDLNISDVSNSSVRISWKKIPEKNNGYCVLYRPKYEDITLPWKQINTTETSLKIISLSPGTLYVFDVFAYTNETIGPAESAEIVTNGKPLSIITGIKSIVNGTTIILQWDAPNDKRTDKWLYGVYTLKPYLNVRVLIGNTTNTNFTVEGLNACEMFRYEVRLIGPFGIGPSKGLNYTKTEFDSLAPPKNLAVKSLPHKRDVVTISWDSSCLKLDEKIGYEIVIHDSITNKTEKKYVKPSSNTHLSVNSSIHFGAKYMIKVRTYNKGSRFTDEMVYFAPKIPVPQQVKVVLEKNGSIFIDWKEPEMPPELSNHSYTYTVWVSEEKNISKALHYTVSSPPVVIPPVTDGKIYHLAVSITEQDGYQSELSDWNDFANPSDSQKIVVSVNNLVSIVVPVVIVILALIFAVGFFAIRHRRLQRSFLSFANSHYEASVSATFSNSEGLDEEDSPMIRGFSDDEPLIVA